MTYAYIVLRGQAYAIQKIERSPDGREREVGWTEGLTRDEAIRLAIGCVLCRVDS